MVKKKNLAKRYSLEKREKLKAFLWKTKTNTIFIYTQNKK